MDNKTAFILGCAIIGFLLLDHFYLEWGVFLFLAQKLARLIDYLSFWR